MAKVLSGFHNNTWRRPHLPGELQVKGPELVV